MQEDKIDIFVKEYIDSIIKQKGFISKEQVEIISKSFKDGLMVGLLQNF